MFSRAAISLKRRIVAIASLIAGVVDRAKKTTRPEGSSGLLPTLPAICTKAAASNTRSQSAAKTMTSSRGRVTPLSRMLVLTRRSRWPASRAATLSVRSPSPACTAASVYRGESAQWGESLASNERAKPDGRSSPDDRGRPDNRDVPQDRSCPVDRYGRNRPALSSNSATVLVILTDGTKSSTRRSCLRLSPTRPSRELNQPGGLSPYDSYCNLSTRVPNRG